MYVHTWMATITCGIYAVDLWSFIDRQAAVHLQNKPTSLASDPAHESALLGPEKESSFYRIILHLKIGQSTPCALYALLPKL
jgi:hypothetical protein